MIRALFTERYSQTDHIVFSEIRFNKSSHYIGTSQSIYIANQLTGFCKVQVSTEKDSRTYTTVCSEIHFSKNYTIEKPTNLFIMVINWLDFIRYELTLKSISKQKLSRQHLLVELSLARLFNSHWHNSPTYTGTIVQQSLAQLFKSHWHDWSTVTGTSDQQSLVWFFNSGWHDCSTVISTIIQQSLARLSNSHWHDWSTVTGMILQ